MAYHYMGKRLSEVPESIDVLDSCAYSVLVMLFSIVEPKIVEKMRSHYDGMGAKKNRKNKIIEMHKAVESEVKGVKEPEILKRVFQNFGQSTKHVGRVERNVKLRILWNNAISGGREQFFDACCRFLAEIPIMDMPGNQCTAVVRDVAGRLYVSANGIWAPGATIADSISEVEGGLTFDPDMFWFSSGGAVKFAIEQISTTLLQEYKGTELVFVNPTLGDNGGKFHAEMQMLEFLIDNDIIPERGYIGVSKPCCQFCQKGLDSVAMKYWTKHNIRGDDPNEVVDELYNSYKDPHLVDEFRNKVLSVEGYGLTK